MAPKQMKTEKKIHNTSVRLDTDLYEKAKLYAQKRRYSLNDVINLALATALTTWNSED